MYNMKNNINHNICNSNNFPRLKVQWSGRRGIASGGFASVQIRSQFGIRERTCGSPFGTRTRTSSDGAGAAVKPQRYSRRHYRERNYNKIVRSLSSSSNEYGQQVWRSSRNEHQMMEEEHHHVDNARTSSLQRFERMAPSSTRSGGGSGMGMGSSSNFRSISHASLVSRLCSTDSGFGKCRRHDEGYNQQQNACLTASTSSHDYYQHQKARNQSNSVMACSQSTNTSTGNGATMFDPSRKWNDWTSHAVVHARLVN